MQQAAIIVVVSVLCFFGIVVLVDFSLPKLNISKVQIAFLNFLNQQQIEEHAVAERHRHRRVSRSAPVEISCKKRSKRELVYILGSVQIFNPYFTSIDKPVDFTSPELTEQDPTPPQGQQFKKWSDLSGFNFSRASQVNEFMRRKSDNSDILLDLPIALPWSCPSNMEWIDLGVDTFPRYVKTAVCTKSCWFDRMVCQPRSFAMVVLRRKCFASDKIATKMVRIPEDLQEEWKSEKIAVNFCCECIRRQEDMPR